MKKITIIGTGYVGLVSGAGLAEFGHSVSCVDIDQEKIKNLNNGQIPIHEPGLDIIVKNNVKEGRLTFSSNIEKNIQEAKIIFIAVGTPQDEKGIADLTAVKSIVKLIADNLINYKIISFVQNTDGDGFEGFGSFSKVSTPANASFPLSRDLIKLNSSTTPPRAALIKPDPFFIKSISL